MKNKELTTALAFLSLFFGGAGLHKFYLGNYLSGFLYVFFWWTFIPVVLCVVDGVRFLNMDDHRFNLLYNYEYMHRLRDNSYRTDTLLNTPPIQARRRQSSVSKTQELKELRQLLVEGAIEESDYEEMKNEILRR